MVDLGRRPARSRCATTRARRACATSSASSPTWCARRSKRSSWTDKQRIVVSRRNLARFAGVRKFRYGEAEHEDLIGVSTGLAWTEVGGELLSIEAVTLPGKGRMTTTGKLGDVMQESIQAAKSYVRSRSTEIGIIPPTFEKIDIHVHVPEGATPKDGPSAGVAMVTSIVSVLTKIPVKREPRDDRRDHAARPRAADRRAQGEAARGAARRHQDRADPEGQREGPRRDPRQREEGHRRSSASPPSTTCCAARWCASRSRSSGPRSRRRRCPRPAKARRMRRRGCRTNAVSEKKSRSGRRFGKKSRIRRPPPVDDFVGRALLYAVLLEIAPAGGAIVKGVAR